MPRRALLCLLFLALFAGSAHAKKPRPSDAQDAKNLLDKLATSSSKEERLKAAEDLAAIGGRVVDELATFLARPHQHTPDVRRAVLVKIKASVPDKNGNFQSPGREKQAQIRADEAFDWLAALVELPPEPALGEVIADVAALRALAASKKVEAARAILDVGFAADTMIYRDECGRQLRKMAPYSIPALIVGSQPAREKAKRNKALQRYTNYQLERMDRQEPGKALAATEDDEDLQIAVLQAYGETEHREAVAAVFERINDDAPRVRAAARDAWLKYVMAPHPPPAPKAFLQMPGGVKSDKEKPLWLNSLELARVELEKRTDELFAEEVPEKADLERVSRRIFEHYDAERSARDAEVIADGNAKAAAGDLPGAIAVYDRLIAEDPARPERAKMAPKYFEYAEQLAKDGKWSEASGMYSKAHGLDPEGEMAKDALAAHYFALGKAQEAEGKDGGASFRRAVELKPDYAAAKVAAANADGATRTKSWMLYVAGLAAVGALALLVLGLARRKA
jgi:tetratricopeptide (TPR) repeat protein